MPDSSATLNAQYVLPSQLCVGLFVHLDLTWSEHPFALSSFLIKSSDQIEKIRALSLARVRWSPDKSTTQPVALPVARPVPEAPTPAPATAGPALTNSEQAIRLALTDRLKEHAARNERCQRALAGASRTVKTIGNQIRKNPAAAAAEGARFVEAIATSMPQSHEIAIHLMSDNVNGEEVYQHSLNVTLLAMMLGRELKLPQADLLNLGQGALFHDAGKLELPAAVVRKADTLTTPEKNLLKTHVPRGVEAARRLGLSPAATAVLQQHHEHADGSGYPGRLQGSAISQLAGIVTVANEFDNLCNPSDPAQAMTPHESLSRIFGPWRTRFDARIVATFVRCMGIYPPGTIVKLSHGVIGMVVSVNSSRPLKPVVMLFDPSVTKESATILDLESVPNVSVLKTLRPAALPADVAAYLAPQRRLTYFFDTQPRASGV